MLASLLFCQIIHELGHAVAAAADAVRLLSIGISLTFVIPSAFVSLSSSSLSLLPPRSRLRIACAGAWHNLLVWLVLAFMSWTQFEQLVWRVAGWHDISARGRNVLEVDFDSPLVHHLPVSSVITRLDDFQLGTDMGSQPSSRPSIPDSWSWYLSLSPNAREKSDNLGWCIPTKWFQQQPSSCCPSSTSQLPVLVNNTSCFEEPEGLPGRCLDAISVFTRQVPSQLLGADGAGYSAFGSRCHTACMPTSDDDQVEYACMRPHPNTQLLRIVVEPPPWVGGRERTVVWNGPSKEVLEQVRVSTVQARWRLLPTWLPDFYLLWMNYTSMITLSLFFINLLPIPLLDGSQALSAVMDVFDPSGRGVEEYDVESLTNTSAVSSRSWRAPVQKAITGATTSLAGFVLIGSVLETVLHPPS